jgi:REP-associated tyrosine transposase
LAELPLKFFMNHCKKEDSAKQSILVHSQQKLAPLVPDSVRYPAQPKKTAMSRKYKFLEPTGLHYFTATTVGWVDIFSRQTYRDILIKSLKWCQENKGLHICAYVMMTNHLHMVAYTEEVPLSGVIGSFKKFTAQQILTAIGYEPESRREWLLRLLGWFGRQAGQEHQVWQHGNHPVALWSLKVTGQKIDYIHLNPVRAGLVYSPEQWRYSSAGAYAGLPVTPELEVEVLDAWGLA